MLLKTQKSTINIVIFFISFAKNGIINYEN